LIIKTINLTKQYSERNGCFNISIDIDKPTIFGLLGPNGAGKSTLLKTLVGLLMPTSGEGFILGKPLGDKSIKSKIGYLPENFRYQDWLSAYEVMEFHCQLLKMKNYKQEIEKLLTISGIWEHRNKKVRSFSKGMQQRLGLAISMLNSPEIIFLDEPTSALDPIGRIEVRNIILDLKKSGTTVFLNSHMLSEVEKICDKVAIIDKGMILAQGSIDELKRHSLRINIVLDKVDRRVISFIEQNNGKIIETDNNSLIVEVDNIETNANIAKILIENGYKLYEIKRIEQLENIFLDVLGEEHFNA